MNKKASFTKTEESIFTLLTLKVLIEQAFESIYGQEDILNSEFDSENNFFHNLVTDTVHEALTYQILLKTCAFLDEWNKILGISTDPKDLDNILLVKKIAKPATKQISQWKQLRDFRNEAIAHNHRDKSGQNIYLHSKGYDFPDTTGELYLMAYCIIKMTDVLTFFFRPEMTKVIKNLEKRKQPKKQKRLSPRAIKLKIKEIDKLIDDPLANIFIRNHMLKALITAHDIETPQTGASVPLGQG